MRRTSDQNAYLHKYLRVLAENMYMVENGGEMPTKRGAKKWVNDRQIGLKYVFAFKFLGDEKTLIPRTRDLDKLDFSHFLDQIHKYVSETWPDLVPVHPRDKTWDAEN